MEKYLGKLKQSVDALEKESNKLVVINRLVNDVAVLVDEVKSEKNSLKDSIVIIDKLKAQINQDCATLSKCIESEKTAHRQLVKDIHKTVAEDAHKIIIDLATPIEQNSQQISQVCIQLAELIEKYERSQKKLLADIESLLINYNGKHIELYNAIIASISNRIDTGVNGLTFELNSKISRLEEKNSIIDKKIVDLKAESEQGIKNTLSEIQKIADNVDNISKAIPFIKFAVSVAMGSGVVACLISI